MGDEKNSLINTSFAKGLLLGGMIGAGLALLYAPKTGRELREEMKKRSSEFKEEADEILKDIKKLTSKILEDGLQLAKEKIKET